MPAQIAGIRFRVGRSMKRPLLAVCVSALAVAIAALAPAVASAWPPPGQATVHPGVMTFTKGAQCTSNFVFTQGSSVYLGQAAHCSSRALRPAPTGVTPGRWRSARR
jgi:hypothetical protein